MPPAQSSQGFGRSLGKIAALKVHVDDLKHGHAPAPPPTDESADGDACSHHDHDHAHGHSHGHEPAHDHATSGGGGPRAASSGVSASGGGHDHGHDHGASRNLPAIKALVKSGPGLEGCRRAAVSAFEQLAAAEASAHGCRLEDVHFHEVRGGGGQGRSPKTKVHLPVISVVSLTLSLSPSLSLSPLRKVGAIDSIVDTVGACLAVHLLGVDECHCSPLPFGSGTVRTAHGLLPVAR